MSTLSLIVPMKDEAPALPALRDALQAAGTQFAGVPLIELVAIDDGSSDGTLDLLRKMQWPCPVRILTHPENLGLSAAIRTGVAAAEGTLLATADADLAYPLSDLHALTRAVLAGAAVATASPWQAGGRAIGLGLARTLPSRAASWLYRRRFGSPHIHTWTCGFRVWRAEALRASLPRRAGFVGTAEMLVRAAEAGLAIAEIPAELRPRVHGRSKMKLVRTALRHCELLARGPGLPVALRVSK